ncbi:MFS transporter [Halosquirtibacter xylanolyticus]|uniref:MFS transporter n=1 Tax=Halosquirtibacter xylanolyticus TaxID=3374599 RepID=UPI003747AFFD|nr:MFS transporter [Prolixibacteraceae bacterium]
MGRNKIIVLMILITWFVISFVTNILGPIMPAIIDNYQLSLTMASFLPFSFFLAYGIMSIPAGVMIERIGEKRSMLVAFLLTLSGSAIFAFIPTYSMALVSLFILGIGMAMLQVIINPLMRAAAGEEHFAFYSVLGQLVFGAASFVSPKVYTYLVGQLEPTAKMNAVKSFFMGRIPDALPWISLYWIFTVLFIVMLVFIAVLKFPKVELQEDEKTSSKQEYMSLLKKPLVWMFTLGIMAYVGTEQGLANWMSQFLSQYHGVDPVKVGADVVGTFWGNMSIGCLVGLLLLKLLDSQLVLKCFTISSMVALGVALFGSAEAAVLSFKVLGFLISVMFSIIFSLALNSYTNNPGAFSGILCSGIFGGALVPMIIGTLGDVIGLRIAMMFLFITLSYILFIAFYAKPEIKNKTIFSNKNK